MQVYGADKVWKQLNREGICGGTLYRRAANEERWPHPFGQSSEIFKWSVRGSHAANLIAGSVAKYASSGVRSSRLE